MIELFCSLFLCYNCKRKQFFYAKKTVNWAVRHYNVNTIPGHLRTDRQKRKSMARHEAERPYQLDPGVNGLIKILPFFYFYMLSFGVFPLRDIEREKERLVIIAKTCYRFFFYFCTITRKDFHQWAYCRCCRWLQGSRLYPKRAWYFISSPPVNDLANPRPPSWSMIHPCLPAVHLTVFSIFPIS